jgi:hypothetical protein
MESYIIHCTQKVVKVDPYIPTTLLVFVPFFFLCCVWGGWVQVHVCEFGGVFAEVKDELMPDR